MPLAQRLGVRILICDDSSDVTDTMAALFGAAAAERHEIRVCHDGLACIDVARQWMPDVAVIDIGMPHANGYQVAKEIRAMPGGKKVLLLAYTGWTTAEDVRMAHEAGFDAHFAKTRDPSLLVEVLDKMRHVH